MEFAESSLLSISGPDTPTEPETLAVDEKTTGNEPTDKAPATVTGLLTKTFPVISKFERISTSEVNAVRPDIDIDCPTANESAREEHPPIKLHCVTETLPPKTAEPSKLKTTGFVSRELSMVPT